MKENKYNKPKEGKQAEMIIQVTLLVRKWLASKDQQYTRTIYKYECEVSCIKSLKRKTCTPLITIFRGSPFILIIANLIRRLAQKGNGKKIGWSESTTK